jgi:hypothetical protein
MLKTARLLCEPYVSKVYDVTEDRVVEARILGYDVALMEISEFEGRGIRNYLAINDRHGIICSPYFEKFGSALSQEGANAGA